MSRRLSKPSTSFKLLPLKKFNFCKKQSKMNCCHRYNGCSLSFAHLIDIIFYIFPWWKSGLNTPRPFGEVLEGQKSLFH